MILRLLRTRLARPPGGGWGRAAIIGLVAGSSGLAQLAVDRGTVAGGGGTSSGGGFAISGTTGQADAGPVLGGGAYTVTGGFWALPVAVPTPGAPELGIAAATPGVATISWAPACRGWTLQESGTLNAPAWVNAPSGTNNPVVVPATPPARFYRLHRP